MSFTEGEAESKRKPIPVIDGLLIGARAIAHNLIVATQNVSDIAPRGARIINPWRL
jgi:predicted nucleic acid-binding protein